MKTPFLADLKPSGKYVMEDVQNMSPEENSDLFSTVHKIIPKVDKLTGATLVAIHNGREAGQEIPHVHVHLVPRSSDDSGGPIHCLFDSTLNISDSVKNDSICFFLEACVKLFNALNKPVERITSSKLSVFLSFV